MTKRSYPIAVRKLQPQGPSPTIMGYRALGPLPCSGCGKTIHIVRRWHGLFAAEIGQPGSRHVCEGI